MRFLPLPFFEDCLQLGAIRGDHFLFQLGGLHHHRHFVVVGADERLAALEAGDGAYLRAGELQRFLYIPGLVRLQVQNNLVLGVVDDRPAVLAVLQTEEIRQILRCGNGRSAEAAGNLEKPTPPPMPMLEPVCATLSPIAAI